MENEYLFKIAKEFFDINPPPYFCFDFENNIPVRKLKNARKLYSDFNSDNEKPIILIDDTIFRTAKLGAMITNTHLLLNSRQSKGTKTGCMRLSDIFQLRIFIYKRGSDLLVNDKKVGFMVAFGLESFKKNEAEMLNKLFELLINSLHSH